ncbi:AAA family ATPase [candidate division WOR-3 bacterium]|nr:AAA family ATPase [candidate division WOR-3 bacterium]
MRVTNRRYLPQKVVKFFKEKKFHESIKGTIIFLDITGFTRVTEELTGNGREGAEILSQIINAVFTPAIDIVERRHGQVIVFAGDAFYAIFEAKRGLKRCSSRALSAAYEITEEFNRINPVKTKFGKFVFSPKTALSMGIAELNIVKCGKRHTYYFSGKPFYETADLLKRCMGYEIKVSPDVKTDLPDRGNFTFRHLSKKAFSAESRAKPLIKPWERDYFKTQKVFIPSNILEKREMGEFREVSVCFTSFEGVENFSRKVAYAEKIAVKYGGFLNKAVVGDKGSVVMAVFGAPTAVEKPAEMAFRYSKDINTKDSDASATGIARGTVYAGLIGSYLACEYTVMGRCVNLSARLAQKAEKGQILVDKDFLSTLRGRLIVKSLGKQSLKGIKDKVEIFLAQSLKDKRDDRTRAFDTIGRENEKKILLDALEKVLTYKMNGGAVFIDGEPGTGKSQLLSDVLCEKHVENNFVTVNLPFESAERESLFPFVEFLRNYVSKNIGDLEKVIQELFLKLKDRTLKKELLLGKAYLIHYIATENESLEFSGLKPEQIIENFSYAFKAFIKALSLIKPIVLVVDDFHCADKDSVELIKILSRNVENYPFVFFFTSRLKDDGKPFETEIQFCDIRRLKLENFKLDLTERMLKIKLQRKSIPVETVEYFHAKTGGNPFFLEQFCLYFLENKLLDENMNVIGQTEEIPADINSVITARFDRLAEDFKETVRNASVLGKEFAVEVLTEMLGKKRINKDLRSGENELIWIKLEKIRYMFKHVLIRDSVYHMMLKGKLRKLHSFAAQIIERIYSKDLTCHYRELLSHWEKAENSEKIVKTGKTAFDYARKMGLKEDSLHYARTLDGYLSGVEKTENRIKWIRLLSKIPEYKKSLELAKKTLEHVKPFSEQYCALINIIFDVYLETGDIGEIKKTHEILKKIIRYTENPVTLIETLESIAMYHHYLNLEEEGYPWAKKALEEARKLCEISQTNENLNLLAKSYSRNAVFFGRQLGFEKVFDYLEKAVELAEKIGSESAKGILYGNLGLSYMEIKLDLDKALFYYHKALKIHEKLQERQGLLITLNNIALILMSRKKLDEALGMLEKAYEMAVEIGDIVMQIFCLINLCDIKRRKGMYEQALEYIEKAAGMAKLSGKDHILGQTLDIKFYLKILTKKFDEAVEINNELYELSKKIKNDFMMFKHELNHALYLSETEEKEKAAAYLYEMIGKYRDDDLTAEIHYAIWKVKGDQTAKSRAAAYYKKVIEGDSKEFKQLSYLEKYEELVS